MTLESSPRCDLTCRIFECVSIPAQASSIDLSAQVLRSLHPNSSFFLRSVTPSEFDFSAVPVADNLQGLQWQVISFSSFDCSSICLLYRPDRSYELRLIGQQYELAGDYPFVNREDNLATMNLAQSNCAATTDGGFSDWRVPTLPEMYSFMDHMSGSSLRNSRPLYLPDSSMEGGTRNTNKLAYNVTAFPDPGNEHDQVSWWTSTNTLINPLWNQYFAIYGWVAVFSDFFPPFTFA